MQYNRNIIKVLGTQTVAMVFVVTLKPSIIFIKIILYLIIYNRVTGEERAAQCSCFFMMTSSYWIMIQLFPGLCSLCQTVLDVTVRSTFFISFMQNGNINICLILKDLPIVIISVQTCTDMCVP